MEFGTWYALNCGPETRWHDDFALARDAGFDYLVLWNLRPDGGRVKGDVRCIVRRRDKTLRALDQADRAGLGAYLGIWHPYFIGRIPPAQRLQWATGERPNAPDLFNREWLRSAWLPYVREAARVFKSHGAYRGAYFDDTFPVMRQRTTSWLSYAAPDRHRFRGWLKRRYGTLENLTMRHRPGRAYRSFETVDPPRTPAENLALWTDWTEARADWCEEFARRTAQAYRAVDPNPAHELVLSDQDYHMQCNALQYGVDYRRVLRHFDRFEIYMAAEHAKIGRRELLADVEADVRRGVALACGKPFAFATWFADRSSMAPMPGAALRAVVRRADKCGARAVDIYALKVYDWRTAYSARQAAGELPPFPEMSLTHNPKVVRAVAREIAALR